MKQPPSDSGTTAARAGGRLRGFTLVEMLVVIGIIGILASSLLGAFGYVKTYAWKSRAQAQVSGVATALTVYLQSERAWPAALLSREELDEEACWVLQETGRMDVKTWKDHAANIKFEDSPDRFGLLDPWGRSKLRKNPLAKEMQVKAHRIQYRLDKDLDGYVDSSEGSPKGAKVRGCVLVWSRGPDGLDDEDSSNPKARNRYPYDDCLSWSYGQASKE